MNQAQRAVEDCLRRMEKFKLPDNDIIDYCKIARNLLDWDVNMENHSEYKERLYQIEKKYHAVFA